MQLFNIQTAYIRILNEIAFISSYSETESNKRPFYTVDLRNFLASFLGSTVVRVPLQTDLPFFK